LNGYTCAGGLEFKIPAGQILIGLLHSFTNGLSLLQHLF